MKVLTPEKIQLDLNDIEDSIPITHFTVIDLGSDVNQTGESDIICSRLIYLEEVSAPAIECQIDNNKFILPLTWNIFIGEEEMGEVEVIPIHSLNARNFEVISTQPIDGFRHHFKDIKLTNIMMDYEWVLPKLKNGQVLAMPYNDAGDCIYITPNTNKIPPTCSPEDFL